MALRFVKVLWNIRDQSFGQNSTLYHTEMVLLICLKVLKVAGLRNVNKLLSKRRFCCIYF